MPDNNTRRLSPKDQVQDRMYEMSLRFAVDAGIAQIDDMLRQCGFQETPYAPGVFTTRIKQTVPFIPDEDTIRRYEEILKKNHSEKLSIAAVRFEGYDYIYAVDRPGLPDAGKAEMERVRIASLCPGRNKDADVIDPTDCERGTCTGCPVQMLLEANERKLIRLGAAR